jgi:hypothetical protein
MARQNCHALGITDIREAELVLLSPEKQDGVKPLPPTKDVTRRGLTLGSATTQCSTRIRSPVSRSGQRAMSPAAKIDGEARLFCERDRRADTDTDDNQVGRQMFAVLQRDTPLVNRRRS